MTERVANFEIRRMPADAFFHEEVPFVDTTGILGFLREVAFEAPLLMVGPSGVGKTLGVYALAQELGYPVVEFSCSEDTRDTHLIGSFGMEGDTVYFGLGALTTAIDLANEMHHSKTDAADGAIVLLNEINALTPQAQKMLNPLLDFQRTVNAIAVGRSFKLDTGAKLWFIGTMNPSAFGGTNGLNQDLMRRLMPLYLGYPTVDQELSILVGLSATMRPDRPELSIPDAVFAIQVAGGQALVPQLIELATKTRQGNMEYQISTADLHQVCRNVQRFGLEKALTLASYKFESESERSFYVAQVQSTTGVDIGSVSVLTPPSTTASTPIPRRRRAP